MGSLENPFVAIHALEALDEPTDVQVLCMGWPRTGTQSLKYALGILGFETYHMGDSAMNGHDQYWQLALEERYWGGGEDMGRAELDRLLAGYSATADFPSSAFPVELMRAYPKAKIILNTRSVTSWIKSMQTTILHARATYGPPDSRDAWAMWMAGTFGNDFAANAEEAYDAHERLVVKEALRQGRDLLVFPLGDEWDNLCRFLGKPIPRGDDGEILEYPHKDTWDAYKKEPTLANLRFSAV